MPKNTVDIMLENKGLPDDLIANIMNYCKVEPEIRGYPFRKIPEKERLWRIEQSNKVRRFRG